MQTTGTTNQSSTVTPPAWLSGAAQNNLSFAQGLQNSGFQPYQGQFVAPFSPEQTQSFQAANVVGGGVLPYVPQAGSLIDQYANATPGTVTPTTIASAMSPYMNNYVSMALAPQLQSQQQQFDTQNKSFDSAATGAGAFGDTGWNLGRTNLTTNQDIARTGLVGNAYNAAFNTAIGAGAQDVATNLNAQTTNAGLREQALNRMLTGGTTLLNAGTGATNLLNTMGAQQTAAGQAQLNAGYNQYVMGLQYPFQTMSATDQAIAAGRNASPMTTTGQTVNQAPNNAGYGLLGAGLGAAATVLGGPIGSAIGGSGSGSPMTWSAQPGMPQGAPMYADGGEPPVGQPSIVGERGPELFVPKTPGTVVPYETLRSMIASRPALTGNFGLAA